MLRIPSTAKRTNLSVVEEVKPKTSTRSNNPPTKITIFRSCNERKITTGTGHYAWSSCRMPWVDGIKEATGLRIEVLKEVAQDRKKMA
jgi:hypothetical protein